MKLDVSVIIINYNTFQLTCNCIRSVIEKTICNYEIILVDNASAEIDADEFLKIFPGILLIKNPVNEGFAKGNNAGLAHAKGKYVLLLNSDTVLLNNAIDLALSRIEKDNTIGALSSQLLYEDGRLQPASASETTILSNMGVVFKLNYLLKNKYSPKDFKSEHFTDWVWGTFMLIPMEVIKKFPGGRLHDDFFMYMEDRQWCWTIRKLGYKILFYPEAKVIHYVSASGGATIEEEKRWKEVILPNEYEYYRLTRNNMYAFGYYISLALIQLTAFNKKAKKNVPFFFRFAFKNFQAKK